MRPSDLRRLIFRPNPRIANVLQDPAGTLGCEPLEIVDRPIPVLIGLAIGAGITYLIPGHFIKVLVLRYLLIGMIVIAPFVAILWRRRITLDTQGFEFAYGRRAVFIPWTLFDRSASFIAQPDTLKLPVYPSAVTAIEHRQDGVTVAYGAKSSFYFLEISPDGIVAISPPMGAESKDLRDLILRVAHSLSSGDRPMAPGVVSPPEQPAVRRLPDGGLEVRRTHLEFPPVCCECERPTDVRLQLKFRDNAGGWPHFSVPGYEQVSQSHTASVPYCPECQARSRRRGWGRTAAVTALLGLPLWGLFLVLWLRGDVTADGASFLAVMASLWTVMGLVGCAAFGFSFRSWPAVQGQLLLERPVVRLHFFRPTYADRLCEWLAQRNGDGTRQAIHTPNGSELI
jgi:hypothetical protein